MKQQNTKHLISAEGFARVARSLAKKSNVTVRLRGSGAYTDGKAIVLPVPKQMSEKTQNILLGYLVHECGHVRTTDFNVSPAGLTNLFEDHRIERNMRTTFKGAEDFMIKAHKSFWGEWQERIQEGNTDSGAFGAAHNWLLAYGQKITMDRNIPQEILDRVDDDLMEKWGAIQLNLIPFLERSVFTNTTADAKRLSDEVLAFLNNVQPPEPEEPNAPDQEQDEQENESQQDSSRDEEQDGDNQNQSDDSAAEESESKSDGGDESNDQEQAEQSDTSANEGETGTDTDTDESDKGEQSKSESQPSDSEDTEQSQADSKGSGQSKGADLEAAKRELKEALDSGEKAQDFGEILMEAIKDEIEEAQKNGELIDIDYSSYSTGSVDLNMFSPLPEVAQKASISARNLRRAVKTMVESVTRAKLQTGRRGRRLDNKRLSRIATGDTRIFSKRTEGIAVDTAITLAVDMSGSMSHDGRAMKAMAATLGLSQVLHQTQGATVRGITFPGYESDVGQVIARGAKPSEKLAGLYPHGGTPIVEAVTDASEELREQAAKRKVLVVITDGVIDRHDVDAINKEVGKDIDTYWIGIGVPSLPFDHAICVDEPEQLGDALIRHASDLLGSAA